MFYYLNKNISYFKKIAEEILEIVYFALITNEPHVSENHDDASKNNIENNSSY